MEQLQIETQVKNSNKKRLKHQNTRLHQELNRLQQEIEALEELDAQKNDQQINQNHQLTALRTEIQSQQRQIKRLKDIIEAARQTNIKQNVIYIRKEEDQLLCLKQQLQSLTQEKQIVTTAHQDKMRKLQQNQPLQKHKDEMQTLWADTKRQNRQLSLKMVELERQIRKYHSIKERAKTKVGVSNSQEQELTHIQLEIQRMNQQSESKHLKWKPNIGVLDNQFFSLKNQLSALQRQAEEVEKDEKIWKMRAAALRNQSELQNDRERLSKVISIVHPQESANPVQPKQRYQPANPLPDSRKNIVYDSIKRYNLSLPRAESTPNAPSIAKKQQNPKQSHDDMQVIKPKQSKLDKSQRSSLNLSQQEIPQTLQKSKIGKNKVGINQGPIVRQHQETKKIPGKVEKDKQNQNSEKNQASYIGVREKHRIKSSIASNLAQEIKRKTDQVKAINHSMIGQSKRQSKTRKHSPKSMMVGQNQKSKKRQDNPQISKDKAQWGNKPSLKRDKSSSLQKINALLPASQNKVTSLSKLNKIKEVATGIVNKPKENEPKAKNQQLVEKVNIQKLDKIKLISPSKNNQSQPLKLSPTSTHLQRVTTNDPPLQKQKKGEPQTKSHKASPQVQKHQKQMEILSSPGKEQKMLVKHPQVAIELIDEVEGVPKIVRRKKVVEGTLVNAGTST